MDDLIAFLRGCLTADKDVALAAAEQGHPEWKHHEHPADSGIVSDGNGHVVVYDEGNPGEDKAKHIALWDPARVLAEVEAKRAIVAAAALTIEIYSGGTVCDLAREALRQLGSVYAGRPGYRDEWRP